MANFTVSNGQILDPTGRPWVYRGLAVLDSEMGQESAATLLQQFPGLNAVNLACGADGNGYATAQPIPSIVSWVNDATSRGIAVMLSDYVPGQPQVRTGQDLQASLTWYSQLAALLAANPWVFWTPENEVLGNLAAMHQAVYSAIRGAGHNGLIFMQAAAGNASSPAGLDPSIYPSMHGIGWNIHVYPWEFNTASQNEADYTNAVRGFVSTFQNFSHSADGVMPVLMGEGGNATDGNHTDDPKIGGKFAVTAAFLAEAGVAGGTCGYLAWVHDWHGQAGDADELTNSAGQLTDYGDQVEADIAANAGTTPPAPPTPSTPSPSGTVIKPGGAGFTDAAGNAWSITAGGSVDESGANLPGGGGTAEGEYFSGTAYFEDASSGSWYVWDAPAGWVPSPAPGASAPVPPPTPTPPPPVPTPPPAPPTFTPSPNNTTISAPGTIVDSIGDNWTISLAGKVVLNGTPIASTANVVLMSYVNGVVWQKNQAGQWYSIGAPNGAFVTLSGPSLIPPA